MPTKEEAQMYMNTLAEYLKIVEEFPRPFNEITTIYGYETIATETVNRMDRIWEQGLEDFFFYIADFLKEIENSENQSSKFIQAIEVCKWMDMRITYLIQYDTTKEFSLWPLVPLSGDCPVKVGALNTNYEETGIWINPKYEILSTYIFREGEVQEKKIANRDAFKNANGFLKNCSCIHWDGTHEILNVVIPNESIIEKSNGILRVGFAPMSDSKKLIQSEETRVVFNGIEESGVKVALACDVESLETRMYNDWRLACDSGVDILFMPELLGTRDDEETNSGYNEHIFQLSIEAFAEGKGVPCVTVLPSYWREGKNSASILYQDGKILGVQEKHVPYVDKTKHIIEALKVTIPWETVLLHIPHIHRVAVVICAEFLANESQKIHDFICGELGATLILVPSYSPGEQDFINVLPGLRRYGATTIWGNCCGAIRSAEKGIGGCDLPGGKNTVILGDSCVCGNSCEGVNACLFRMDIPLRQTVKKVGNKKDENIVRHIIKK